jgi:hypothetical protein
MEASTATKFTGRIIESSDDVTPAVLEAMAHADNGRLREIAASFVRHMQAFAREVRLTEAEYDCRRRFSQSNRRGHSRQP